MDEGKLAALIAGCHAGMRAGGPVVIDTAPHACKYGSY